MKLQAGFTFIELLVVLAIFGVILSITAVTQIDAVGRSHVREERDLFVSLILASARTRALANVDESSHGVYIDQNNHQYILFTGDSFDHDEASNRFIPFVNDTTLITYAHDDPIVIFETLSGNVLSGSGEYTLESNGIALMVTLNEVGQIDW